MSHPPLKSSTHRQGFIQEEGTGISSPKKFENNDVIIASTATLEYNRVYNTITKYSITIGLIDERILYETLIDTYISLARRFSCLSM